MPIRRAGLIDAPDGTVQTPNLSGGAHPAAAQAYEDLARTAKSLGDLVQPAVDAETEKRASEASAQGDYRRTAGITRQDQLYDKIVDAGQMAQGSTDVERIVGELENKHLADLDMGKFGEELAAARSQHLEGLDSRYAVPLRQAWDQRGLQATQRLSAIAVQKGIARAQDALEARQSLVLDRISGASDPTVPEVSLALTELSGILDAQVATGKKTPEQADYITLNALSKMEANRFADEALASYQEAGYSDEAYTASLKVLDEAMADPKLALDRSERNSYLGSARSALNATRSEIRREQRELDAALRDAETRATMAFNVEIGDASLRAGEGYAPDEAELTDLYKKAVAADPAAAKLGISPYVAKVARIAMTADVQQHMRGLSIPQQDEFVGNLQLAAAGGDKNAAAQLDPARKVASAARSAATDDPATYAAVTEKRDLPIINWSGKDVGETMVNRFNEAAVAAKSLGVPVKYFSAADRRWLKAAADKGGADAVGIAAMINQSANEAGIDPLEVFSEISGSTNAPLLATAGALMAMGVEGGAPLDILSGPSVMGTEFVKDKMPSQAIQARAQRNVLGDRMTQMSPAAIDALTRSADAIYATRLFRNKGQPDSGEGQSYEASLRAAMGEWMDETGKPWGGQAKAAGDVKATVPPWIRQGDFAKVVKEMTPDELRLAIHDPLGRLGKVGTRDATAADIRSAALIDAGNGRYYLAPDPARPTQLITVNGRPAVLNLNNVRDSLKTRAPDAVR